ncbi:MAG TPA: TlpA family protein disulfide reductase [Bacteroidales bacterium]
MKLVNLTFLLLLIGYQSYCQVNPTSVPRLNYQQFEPYLHRDNDTLYVVNFWASWCVPCREELPAFERIRQKYEGKKVKVLLVSLDLPNQVESRLLPFIRKNQLKSEVILLNDPHQNEWIDKVDPKWSGAIPFTQIYGKGFRESYERTFQFNELDSLINHKLYEP